MSELWGSDKATEPAHRVPMLQVSPPRTDSTAEVEAASVDDDDGGNPFQMFCDELREEVGRACMENTAGGGVGTTGQDIENIEMSNTIKNNDVEMTETEVVAENRIEPTNNLFETEEHTPRRCPQSPIQLQEEDKDLLQDSYNGKGIEDDSGYGTGRKRIRISVDKYKARKPVLQSPGGDHLVFDRISPKSRYYKTPFIPSEKPVNRVLFPKAVRKKNSESQYQEQEKIQPENCEFSSDEEPEPQKEPEPENIYDPLSPYRHTWTDSNLVALYVLRRW
ncbi:hypothetical protein TWF730_008351 [Orbilia blumenaviensis]|uniref:Uncharacterized protein n=1 Tax=Orbilia blumenaviensis TaxID=1796055 RepID=A0AAV9V281_9PEZI